MSSSWTAYLDPLVPSAHEWLSGRLFAEAAGACREYVDENRLTEPIPKQSLQLRVQELSEAIEDMLGSPGSPVTVEMLSSKLDISIEFKSIHSVNNCTWFAAEATVSGEALRMEETLVLDFGGPATVDRLAESHNEGEDSDVRSTQCGPTTISSARKSKRAQRRRQFFPHMLSRPLSHQESRYWHPQIRNTCFACVLKALSTFDGFPAFEEADCNSSQKDPRWETVLSRWMHDKSRRHELERTIRDISETLTKRGHEELVTHSTIIKAEPQGEWEPHMDSDDDNLLRKRKCKVWACDGGITVTHKSGNPVQRVFTLEVRRTDLPRLLEPTVQWTELKPSKRFAAALE